MPEKDLTQLNTTIIACTLCPRLVTWREQIAQEKVKRFANETYWGKAVPGFGDPHAKVLVVGLAPAAHGANRTGRMFTGDRSGDWLYRAMYRAGFANQETSVNAEDGLRLMNAYVTSVGHCAPPDNKPLPEELAACQPYLIQTLAAMPQLNVIVALGKIAFDAVYKTLKENDTEGCFPKKKPDFGHGSQVQLPNGMTLIGSYHPSQQNTFTGKLTEPMLDAIFTQAKALGAQK